MRLSCLVSRQRPFNRYFVGLVLVVGVFIIYYLLVDLLLVVIVFMLNMPRSPLSLRGGAVEWKQSRGTHLLSIMKHDFSRFYNIPSELLFDLFAKPQHIFLLLF